MKPIKPLINKTVFVTEVNKPQTKRSQTSNSKRNNEISKLYNERPKSRQTGHIYPKQIKASKIKVLDFMINEGTQFANLDNIEEFYIENSNENSKKYDKYKIDILKKKEYILKLDGLIEQVIYQLPTISTYI